MITLVSGEHSESIAVHVARNSPGKTVVISSAEVCCVLGYRKALFNTISVAAANMKLDCQQN